MISAFRQWATVVVVGLGLGMALGCSDRGSLRGTAASAGTSSAGGDSAAAVPVPRRDAKAVVIIGTSLTAGLGLDPDQAYPALLQQKVDSAGLDFRVVNAGVSGETSAGSRRQAEWLLGQQPVSVLVIETGANDGLRGLDVDSMRANIQVIIDRARAMQPPPLIVLVGMEAPPNLGATYTRRFRQAYRDIAEKNGIPLVPFLLEGVAGIDSLNQADGIHPTAAGQRRLAENVWQILGPTLRGVT